MAIKHDPVGKLIQQLQVVRDDITFLERVGQTPDINQYPEMQEALQRLIFTPSGKFTPHIHRLEKAGFLIAMVRGTIYIYFEQTGGRLSFRWTPPAERVTAVRYRPKPAVCQMGV